MDKEREVFKAWFKKEYLGIDALANQGDEGAMIRRDYAYVGYQAAKAESHKQAALYQFEINHLAQANEQWREKAATAQAIPEGFVLVPMVPSERMINAVRQCYEGEAYLPYSLYSEFVNQAIIERMEAQEPTND